MDSVETGESIDPRQNQWDKFIRRTNEIIDSGNLDEWEVDYKINLGREFAEAREAVLNDAEDWADRLKVSLKDRTVTLYTGNIERNSRMGQSIPGRREKYT